MELNYQNSNEQRVSPKYQNDLAKKIVEKLFSELNTAEIFFYLKKFYKLEFNGFGQIEEQNFYFDLNIHKVTREKYLKCCIA